ncbi:MAG: TIR domain-containing protein [Bacteroidota bacterium]
MSDVIFISYRRDDSGGVAGRLQDYLEDAFGKENVFKDIADIPPGADFREVIGSEIMQAKVVLIVIGKHYTKLQDAQGHIRLMKESDYVRIEAATAVTFRDKKIVIPVLVNGARMPSQDELPESLKELPFLNGLSLTNANWRTDVKKLIDYIESRLKIRARKMAEEQEKQQPRTDRSNRRRAVPPKSPAKSPRNWGFIIGGAIVGCFLLLLLIGLLAPDDIDKDDTTPNTLISNNFDAFPAYVNASKLNVRHGIGKTARGKDKIERGDAVTVINSQMAEDGKEWYYVEYNNGMDKGWVAATYLSKNPVEEEVFEPETPSYDSKGSSQQQVVENVPSAPVSSRSQQDIILGTWNLVGMKMNGNYMTLKEIFNNPYAEMKTTFLPGIYNTIVYSNGVQQGYEEYNYVIENGYISTSSLTGPDMNGPILLLNDRKLQVRTTFQNGFDQFTSQGVVYFER